MTAYAALVSLTHILHQILHPPPLNKIIIDRQQIEFLQAKVDLLIHFLETYPITNSDEIRNLHMQIADAAYAAEDIIESNVMDQIRSEDFSSLCSCTQTVLDKFLSLETELIRIQVKEDPQSDEIEDLQMQIGDTSTGSDLVIQAPENKRSKGIKGVFSTVFKKLFRKEDLRKIEDGNLEPENSATASSSRHIPSAEIRVVGFQKYINQIMELLATDESNRQTIPIVGMGGIGKTTLATAVYNNPSIVEHFDVRAWVTVSQQYTVRDLLRRLLLQIRNSSSNKQEGTDIELGVQLHKELFGRRYLVVMDDMWDIKPLEEVARLLPSNNNGSRILVTTRLSNLTDNFTSCSPFQVDVLDEFRSWDLLCQTIFRNEGCTAELKEIGKKIAKRCCGLPLALVVVGGLLAKSERSEEHWESFAGELTNSLNHGNDHHLLEILSLSYCDLPIYLKPCFLYLAMFPEDFEIRVSTLIRLWVAEGLIKPNKSKCLEEVAYEYLEDLTSRNLLLVHKRGTSGKVKLCKIHDLIRDLCVIEAEKEKFLCIAKLANSSPNIENKRRLSVFIPDVQLWEKALESLQSAKFSRSWLSLYKSHMLPDWWKENRLTFDEIINGFRLLRVVHVSNYKIHIDILNLRNLRYVVSNPVGPISWMSLSWNLQTLIVDEIITLPVEIWQMPQLRHLKMYGITLTDPDDQNVIVLENLQTLKVVRNFKCTQQILKRILNLKALRIAYYFETCAAGEQVVNYCLNNLERLEKLESLGIYGAEKLWIGIAFPISLKKLSLWNCKIPWEDLSIVGKLPKLEALKLYPLATRGEEWSPIEEQFCRLKFLLISCCELKIWEAEDIHFGRLERLVLVDMKWLEEIPIIFAEMSTLQVIELDGVKDSVRTSAKAIAEEQEQLGYEPLQVRKYDRPI